MTYQLGTLGKSQQTSVLCTSNAGGALNNKYLVLDGFALVGPLLDYTSNSASIVAWFNSDGGGVQPVVSGASRYLAVSVLSDDSADTVASKLASAVDSDLSFAASASTNAVTVTNAISGARTGSHAGNSGFTVSTLRTGTQGFTGGYSPAVQYNVEAVDPVYHPTTGMIYFALYGADLLIVDPAADTWTKVTPPAFVEPAVRNGQARWAGSCLAPNGKIYMPPYESNQVLIIDPSYPSSDAAAGHFFGVIESAGRIQTVSNGWGCYVGTCLIGDKIYCSPMDLSSVLVIDTTTDTVSLISIPGASDRTYDDVEEIYYDGWKWGFGEQGVDGIIYFAPHVPNSNGIQILTVDPVAGTAATVTCPNPLAAADDGLWWGAAKSGGKIYFAPYGPTKALVIDTNATPVTKTLLTIPGAIDRGPLYFGNFQGACIGPDGQVLFIPAKSTFLASIDPLTDTITTTDVTGLGGDALCGGACLAPNGVVYTGPYFSSSLIKFAISWPEIVDNTPTSASLGTLSLTAPATLALGTLSGVEYASLGTLALTAPATLGLGALSGVTTAANQIRAPNGDVRILRNVDGTVRTFNLLA